MIHKFTSFLLVVALFAAAADAQQIPDPNFNPHVEIPAYTKNFPRVLFDEAHNNFHTTTGRYKPFVDLIFNDGYQLRLIASLSAKSRYRSQDSGHCQRTRRRGNGR